MATTEITKNWGTIAFEVPDFIKPIRETINSAFEFLVSILDIALKVLNFIKSFLIGYLDPIVSAIQAILDEITALVNDIRQIGVFITSDYKLLNWPFDDLKGGFQAYERRMIARMTDRTDPTRPNVSGRTQTFGAFFYMSVDISEIQRLIAFIKQLIAFFNQQALQAGGYPVPTITSVNYGAETANIMTAYDLNEYLFKFKGTPPQIAEVRWSLNQITPVDMFNPFPSRPPDGFVITVSTYKDGIPLYFDRPQSSANTQPSANNPEKKVQPRSYGAVREKDTNKALVIYGGADNLALSGDLGYNASMSNNSVKPDRTRVYGFTSTADKTILPLECLISEDKKTYYFQRMFYMGVAETGNQWVQGQYIFHLNAKDMPHDAVLEVQSDGTIKATDAGIATTLYVRVASCYNKKIVTSKGFVYDLNNSAFKGMVDSSGLQFPVIPLKTAGDSPKDLSSFSNGVQVVFPNTNTAEYIKAVKSALLLLVLVRPDLIPIDEIAPSLTKPLYESIKDNKTLLPGICLEPCGLEGFRQLPGMMFNDYQQYLEEKNMTVAKFRNRVRTVIDAFVQDLYDATGPMPQLEKMVVDATVNLRKKTWKEIFENSDYKQYADMLGVVDEGNIWEGLVDYSHEEWSVNGLALNPFSIEVPKDLWPTLFKVPGLITGRATQMQEVKAQDEDFTTASITAPKDQADLLMKYGSPSLKIFYEKSIQPDGSISIPPIAQDYFDSLIGQNAIVGSADNSPVFVINNKKIGTLNPKSDKPNDAVIIYCRGLFTSGSNTTLLEEAALALNVAASTIKKSRQDGQWIAYRFFGNFPGLEDFFITIQNWVTAVRATLTSIVDTIKKYIEFIEARIIELQQLLRRINSIIQSILGFAFQIPKASGLLLVSNGTDGLLSDFVTAKNKPSDSPLAYGAGVAIVIPVGIPFVMDLLKAIFIWTDGKPPDNEWMGSEKPPFPVAVGIQALPPPAPPPGDEVPPETL